VDHLDQHGREVALGVEHGFRQGAATAHIVEHLLHDGSMPLIAGAGLGFQQMKNVDPSMQAYAHASREICDRP
jgi:hypothetical protein